MTKKTCDKCGRDEKDEQVPMRHVSIGAFTESTRAISTAWQVQVYPIGGGAIPTETVYQPCAGGVKKEIDLCESCFESFVNGALLRFLDEQLKH